MSACCPSLSSRLQTATGRAGWGPSGRRRRTAEAKAGAVRARALQTGDVSGHGEWTAQQQAFKAFVNFPIRFLSWILSNRSIIFP